MGGTEAFPDLGKHCQHPDCNQLDFLPFDCDGCKMAFCLEHRSYKSHNCQKPDKSRKVFVCETCSMAIEITGYDQKRVQLVLKKHENSGECDPRKKKKPICTVRRCTEVLTFANNVTCKNCGQKVCLKHRFPTDHACKEAVVAGGRWNNKFLLSLALRNGGDCATTSPGSKPSANNPSVKAC